MEGAGLMIAPDIPGDLDPAEPRSLIRRTLQGAHTS